MTVDEAIKGAIETVKKHFEGAEQRLEEVQVEDDGSYEVTVSYRPPDFKEGGQSYYLTGLGGKRAAIGVDPNRIYKEVVFKPNGEVKAIRMRQIVVG